MTPLPNIAGGLVALVGVSVLVGWAAHVPWLVQIPGAAPVQPVSALAYVLLGLGLLRRHSPETRILGGLAAALGAAVLAQYVSGYDLGVDRVLGVPWVTTHSIPGRMAPGTAIGVTLAGVALQCRRHPVLQALTGSLVLALGAVPLLGYAAGVEAAYLWSELVTAMAVRSAGCLVVLGAGIILDGHERARDEWAAGVVGLVGGLAVAAGTWQALISEGAPWRVQGVVVGVLVIGAGLVGWLMWSLERLGRVERERDDAVAAREGMRQAREGVRQLRLIAGGG